MREMDGESKERERLLDPAGLGAGGRGRLAGRRRCLWGVGRLSSLFITAGGIFRQRFHSLCRDVCNASDNISVYKELT